MVASGAARRFEPVGSDVSANMRGESLKHYTPVSHAVLLVLVNSTQVAAHKPLWSDGDKPMHIPNLVTSFAVYRDIEWLDVFRFPGWWVRIHTFFGHGPQLLAAVGVAAATLAFVVGRR